MYGRIADLIRVEFGKCFEGREKRGDGNGGVGRGESGTNGWCCVVGDSFGSCVSHRMKTYM